MRHLLSMDDLAPDEIRFLVQEAIADKRDPDRLAGALRDRTLLMLFAKPSLRTRLSFETGMTQLGGHAIYYGLGEKTLGTREQVDDLGAVSSRYVDAIMARLYAHSEIETLARHSTVPVINGLTDHEHPCQILADLATVEEHIGLDGAILAYVGDARNNVTHSLTLACAKIGVSLRVGCPTGLGPDPEVLVRARKYAEETGAELVVTEDPETAVVGADAVYTDTWMSYHTPDAEKAARRKALEPYRVTADLLGDAWFLHCLPAYRGEEVTAEVLDGPQSLVLDQAQYRMHAQKALLCWLLGALPE